MRYFNCEDLTIQERSGMNPQLGHVRGKVIDMDGNGIRHSKVWIRETDRSTYTDKEGNFVIINIMPAVYTLIAESEGHFPTVMPDMPVISGDNPGFLFVMYPNSTRSCYRYHCGALEFQM